MRKIPRDNASLRQFIEQRIERVTESGCWIWMGSMGRTKGYGHAIRTLAHRMSWEVFNGPIPQGQQVLHRCDVRLCINPNHLFLGSAAENVADMMAKNRQAKGERCGSAKPTTNQVLTIRNDPRIAREIGVTHGVSQSLVSLIKQKAIWKHV